MRFRDGDAPVAFKPAAIACAQLMRPHLCRHVRCTEERSGCELSVDRVAEQLDKISVALLADGGLGIGWQLQCNTVVTTTVSGWTALPFPAALQSAVAVDNSAAISPQVEQASQSSCFGVIRPQRSSDDQNDSTLNPREKRMARQRCRVDEWSIATPTDFIAAGDGRVSVI